MKFFKLKNLIQMYAKTHQIAPFLKNFSGGMPPNPPSKAHGGMSLRDIQVSKSQKKNSWPSPLPNPGDAPVIVFLTRNTNDIVIVYVRETKCNHYI